MLVNISEIFIDTLEKDRMRIFPDSPAEYTGIISDAVHTALSLIARTDALYHDVEHTCLVTLCRQDIFSGKKILEGELNQSDWLHYTLSLLFHDIGYLKNILNGDYDNNQQIDKDGNTIELGFDDTDAKLTPYHVHRGQWFVEQRKWNSHVNANLISDLISFTQFPVPDKRATHGANRSAINELATLVGCADLIGQLADPHYDKKIPCLYYEFHETGAAAKLGYKSPGDLKEGYPGFFYNFVKPHIGSALKYLDTSDRGRQWISNLNYHVFSQTHRATLEDSGVNLLSELCNYSDKSDNLDDFIDYILNKVCDYKGWPVGHAYKVQIENKLVRLITTKLWYLSETTPNVLKFKDLTETYIFQPGEGLPGRVFEKQTPQWIIDVTQDPNFPRAHIAGDIGVKGAFAFPVFGTTGVEYVLEFYSLNAEEADNSVLSFMQQVSYEISKNLK